jgi:hypothetical protein
MSRSDIKNSPSGAPYELGEDDQINSLIEDIREMIDSVEKDDPYFGSMPVFSSLARAADAARRFAIDAVDSHYERMQAGLAITKASADARAAALPTSGWGSPLDLQTAQAAARKEAEATAARAVGNAVLAEVESKGGAVAKKFNDKFTYAVEIFDRDYSDWSGPAALKMGNQSLDLIARQEAVRKELMLGKRPATDTLRALQAVLKSDDGEKIAIFCRAAREVAHELIGLPNPIFALRLQGARDQVDDERGAAFMLRNALDEIRQKSRPHSLEVEANVLGQTRLLSRVLFGIEPTATCESEFTIRGSVPNSGLVDASRKPWRMSPSWVGRFLPGVGTLSLPGWRPIAWRNSLGAVSRRAS